MISLLLINFQFGHSECGRFFQLWRIFASVTHLSKCGASFNVCRILPSVVHFFFKCDAFFQMWYIFRSVAHFSKCCAFFPVWCIFPRVAHFSRCDRIASMDSSSVLFGARQDWVAKICNASAAANTHKLQNDQFTISGSVLWTTQCWQSAKRAKQQSTVAILLYLFWSRWCLGTFFK